MSISFGRYVKITSGVGGAAGVRQRDLIMRILSQHAFIPPDSILEFGDAVGVSTFFGSTSNEARRATQYFGYVSPNISSPKKLSFGRHSPTGNASAIYGKPGTSAVSKFTPIVAGVLTLSFDGVATAITALSFAAAASMSDVATTLQTAIRAKAGIYALATVIYSPTFARLIIELPLASLGVLSAVPVGAGNTDVGTIAGLYEPDALNVNGVAAMSVVDAYNNTLAINNNFGSFLFNSTVALADRTLVAAANAARNVEFIYSTTAITTDAVAASAALIGFAGTAVTLVAAADGSDFTDMVPGTILAATDYNKRGATQNYMYRQFANIAALVTTDAAADTYDGLRVNYYGQTSKAGQNILFYQRGVLMGGATAATDMNVYANEMWLKDYAGSQIMALQLSMGRIPANATGAAYIGNVLQPVIKAALRNGTISVGKDLTAIQKVYVESITGDSLAWIALQNIGYVLSVSIESYTTTDSRIEYKAVYDLIYAKDDAIRSVTGTHTLV